MIDNHTEPTNEPVDFALIAAQRRYGICSSRDCDLPIAMWCTRCRAKMCSRHARVVQLAPDYRVATLCYRCEPAANVEDDSTTLTIRRPDFDPTEEQLSEPHAAWWIAGCIRRYLALLASQAPALLLDRELSMIGSRLDLLRAARDRARIDTAAVSAAETTQEGSQP